MGKKPITIPELSSWTKLNDALRDAEKATEAFCQKLLEAELKGRRRQQFVKRIHSRLNKARADRERAQLEEKLS